ERVVRRVVHVSLRSRGVPALARERLSGRPRRHAQAGLTGLTRAINGVVARFELGAAGAAAAPAVQIHFLAVQHLVITAGGGAVIARIADQALAVARALAALLRDAGPALAAAAIGVRLVAVDPAIGALWGDADHFHALVALAVVVERASVADRAVRARA